MKNRFLSILLASAVLSIVALSFARTSAGQSAAAEKVEARQGAERVLHHQKAEVEKAIQDLHATLKGRLPILDGFANDVDEPWDRFARGYYECAVRVVAQGQNETLVHITAKISAWYTDANPAKSGYRELVSNGRVEADLLDRIEESLAPPGQTSAPSQTRPARESKPESPFSPNSGSLPPHANTTPNIDTSTFVRGGMNSSPHGSPAVSHNAPPGSLEDMESLKRRREEADRQLGELNSDVQNLEEILRNQTHPTDIAVVRKSGTRVMAKPGASGPSLFSAESEDEFQVLDSGPDWVHVQISGASRGWIRQSDLIMPEGRSENSSNAGAAAAPAAETSFRVVREETNEFKGKWEPLSGKRVKIIWAGAASMATKPATGAVKRHFAKSIFITAYREISTRDPASAGVVIVFDSADGGQVAATVESLKQWQMGNLSDASFWLQCSVDPPDFFDP